MRKIVQHRVFRDGMWALLTDFARDVVDRINALVTTDDLADASVTPAKVARVPAMDRSRSVATQSIPGTGVMTALTMDTTAYVEGGVDAPNESTNGIRIVRDGRYLVTGVVRLDPAAGGLLEMQIQVNGVALRAVIRTLVAASPCEVSIAWPLNLVKNDDVVLNVSQSTGASIATYTVQQAQPALSVTYLGGT